LDLSYGGRTVGPLNWSIASGFADFDRPNGNLVGIYRINGKRLDLEPRLQLPLDATFGFVHFVAGYRYTKYDLEDVPVGADAEPERKIWLGSMDGGLFFDRDSNWFGAAMIQTLEPRLYYLYQQYANQNELPQFDVTQLDFTYAQLFRDNRFAGIDRIADANQLAAALTTRVLNATGQELLRLSVGQIIYFEDRQVTLSGTPTSADQHSRSPYAGSMGVTLGTDFTFVTNATFDPNDSNWDELGIGLQYRRDNRHIINIGYRRRDDLSPLLRQSDQSVYWSVFRNWSFIGRFNYDWEEKRTIDAVAGLEYSDCCWQIRLVGHRFLNQPGAVQTPNPEDEEGIYLQVVFKGLAGFGSRIDSMMEHDIAGYRAETF
jgi:LPS-assembly protein